MASWRMPTVSGIPGPHRFFFFFFFFFFSFDCGEPPHVHVQRDAATCKFRLDPVALASNNGFAARDLTRVRRDIFEHRPRIMEVWNEHCRRAR